MASPPSPTTGALVSTNGDEAPFAHNEPAINSYVSLGESRVIPDG